MKDDYIKIKRSDLIMEIVAGIVLFMFFGTIICVIFDLDPFNTYSDITEEDRIFYEKHPDYNEYECSPDPLYRGCF